MAKNPRGKVKNKKMKVKTLLSQNHSIVVQPRLWPRTMCNHKKLYNYLHLHCDKWWVFCRH